MFQYRCVLGVGMLAFQLMYLQLSHPTVGLQLYDCAEKSLGD